MNPFTDKVLDTIEGRIKDLREALEAKDTDIARHVAEKEAMQQELWTVRKELSTLRQVTRDYDGLQMKNEVYEAERDGMKEGVTRILRYARALGEAHRS